MQIHLQTILGVKTKKKKKKKDGESIPGKKTKTKKQL